MLSRCIINQDVVFACMSHALSTEKEEVMGLLLGRFLTVDKKIAFVERSFVLSRKDKKRDRVEVSYDHLAIASTVAEELSRIDKRDDARVIGWYHSHPHITVHPSHVDVKTQGQYQALGDWLGLIFSVFDKGRLEICAFQSIQNRSGSWDRVEIPVTVVSLTAVPHAYEAFRTNRRMLESLPAMQQVLLNEEKETFEENMRSNGGLLDTSRLGVSRALSIYHSALLRLVDLQLCPLLQALHSKKASLEAERTRLLKLLENGLSSGSATASTNNKHPPTTNNMMVGDSSSSSSSSSSSGSSSSSIHQQHTNPTGFEDSKLAREALEMTIPRYSQGMNALSFAFAGFKAILMSTSTGIADSVSHASSSSSSGSNGRSLGNTVGISKLRKGDTYVVSIERNCTARFGQAVISPWVIVFRSGVLTVVSIPSDIPSNMPFDLQYNTISDILFDIPFNLPSNMPIDKSLNICSNATSTAQVCTCLL